MIEEFQGEYRWLSNFWPAKVELDGVIYPTVEHAYQAAKTLDTEERRWIASAQTPGIAKRRSRGLSIRLDWKEINLAVMLNLLQQKFKIPELRDKLLATEDQELVEGNWWKDTFWGKYNGVGENNLGKLLMQVRENIRKDYYNAAIEVGKGGIESGIPDNQLFSYLYAVYRTVLTTKQIHEITTSIIGDK